MPQDVQDIFPEAFCDPFYKEEYPPGLPCFGNTTGKPLFHIPPTWMRLISRKRFRRVLSHGLDIEYGKKLDHIETADDGPVALIFEDGTRHEADIVIGADGPRSVIRTQLLGEEKSAVVKSPWAISLVLATYETPEQALFVRQPHPVWHMVYGPDGVGGLAGQFTPPSEH